MTSQIILGVLAVAGLITLVIEALGKLRDRLLDDGWLSERSWLGKARRRGFQRRIEPALSAVGITADHFDALRGAAAEQATKGRTTKALRNRPDRVLISAIKPWIVKLDDGAAFRGNNRYVDTMGLVHHRKGRVPSLAAIADAWVGLLHRNEALKDYDCVVTLKEGNSVLVTEFCSRVSPTHLVTPILCKSPSDSSRVQRDSGLHETDFEGLRAFMETMGPPKPPRTRYRALALDDNCTSGTSLFTAISEFNEFVLTHQVDFPFEPIDQAAVLFVVRTGKEQEFVFQESSVTLHSMLALGSEEMEAIEKTRAKDAPALADNFKDHPACVLSTSLPQLVPAVASSTQPDNPDKGPGTA